MGRGLVQRIEGLGTWQMVSAVGRRRMCFVLKPKSAFSLSSQGTEAALEQAAL